MCRNSVIVLCLWRQASSSFGSTTSIERNSTYFHQIFRFNAVVSFFVCLFSHCVPQFFSYFTSLFMFLLCLANLFPFASHLPMLPYIFSLIFVSVLSFIFTIHISFPVCYQRGCANAFLVQFCCLFTFSFVFVSPVFILLLLSCYFLHFYYLNCFMRTFQIPCKWLFLISCMEFSSLIYVHTRLISTISFSTRILQTTNVECLLL